MIYIKNTDAQTLKREENEQQKTNQKTLVSLCRETGKGREFEPRHEQYFELV